MATSIGTDIGMVICFGQSGQILIQIKIISYHSTLLKLTHCINMNYLFWICACPG